MTSVQTREQLLDALQLDLVGPTETADGRQLGSPDELLPQAPSRWYLTGLLVPLDADESQRTDETSADELDSAEDGAASDDGATPEAVVARVSYMPSSIGLSVLVAESAKRLHVELRWGDYRGVKQEGDREIPSQWQRIAKQAAVEFDLPEQTEQPIECEALASGGLFVAAACSWRWPCGPRRATARTAACLLACARSPSLSSTAERRPPTWFAIRRLRFRWNFE